MGSLLKISKFIANQTHFKRPLSFTDNPGTTRQWEKRRCRILRHLLQKLWAHLGSNQGPPDYESGALTN